MPHGLYPESPVPLYHQIAEAIRARIQSGELAPGDALEPLREAAERWGVNLHTVRHAYTALARDGLVETRSTRGTRVAPTKPRPARRRPEVQAFVRRVADEGRALGLSASELAAMLAGAGHRTGDNRPVVYVVECSEWQCECHARELQEHYLIDARPWSLQRAGEPPAGVIVATYFHYNDLRGRWPHRLREVRFVTIGPDPDLAAQLPSSGRLLVVERDEPTAQNIAGDVSVELPPGAHEIVPVTSDNPGALLADGARDPILFSPRVWSELSDDDRAHPRAHEARYVFDARELEKLGVEQGWMPALAPTAERRLT